VRVLGALYGEKLYRRARGGDRAENAEKNFWKLETRN
jgi:hypothetical protein